MTYLSSSGIGNYESRQPAQQIQPMQYGGQKIADVPVRGSYGPNMPDKMSPKSEHSWYANGNANPGYSAGINSVAETYMKTPCCGKYPSIDRFV